MRGYIKTQSEKQGTHAIVISLGKDATSGKYKQHWETFKGSKREAEKRLSELLHQFDTGNFTKPTKTTVADFLNKWLDDYARHNLTPRSFERYKSVARVHLIPSLGNIPLAQLKGAHIQAHYTKMIDS